jgi:hypothetical protein
MTPLTNPRPAEPGHVNAAKGFEPEHRPAASRRATASQGGTA